MSENYFVRLNGINVQDKVEKKNGLSYLSWSWAWGEVKKVHPDATYTVYENANGMNYHTDGRTCWVKTGVTVNGIEHIEYLPVMNNRNQSINLDNVTSMDVNKAIQRSITKACARHGLGLYIYAGEDLPEGEEPHAPEPPAPEPPKRRTVDEKLRYISNNAPAELLKSSRVAFGEKLENATEGHLNSIIKRIEGGKAWLDCMN